MTADADPRGSGGPVGGPAARDPAGDGDVRARRRHVVDERVDLGGGRGSRHDGQRRAVGDRARGAGLGRVHPDRQQGRRPDRPQAGLRARPARLRHRRAVDGARPERHGDRHLLGDHRRPRRVAAAAGDAVADPRQLRGSRSNARSTRWSARRRRSPPRSARCSAASSPPTCRGGSRSCSRSSSSPSCCRASSSSATSRTPDRDASTSSARSCRSLGMGGIVLGILVWQEGGESVGALLVDRCGSRWRRWRGGWCAASAQASRR